MIDDDFDYQRIGYVKSLRTIPSGRGTSSMEFSAYEPAPEQVKEEIVTKAGYNIN